MNGDMTKLVMLVKAVMTAVASQLATTCESNGNRVNYILIGTGIYAGLMAFL